MGGASACSRSSGEQKRSAHFLVGDSNSSLILATITTSIPCPIIRISPPDHVSLSEMHRLSRSTSTVPPRLSFTSRHTLNPWTMACSHSPGEQTDTSKCLTTFLIILSSSVLTEDFPSKKL